MHFLYGVTVDSDMEINNLKDFGFGTQIRKSPFFNSTVKWGATGFSVYNHMYIPRDFGNPEENFWNLINNAILCDVAVERQVEITGPDASKFVQLLTGRNLSNLQIGQCKYVLLTNAEGGLLNDPVLIRLGINHFWLSLADSDILLWAQGVQVNSGLNVCIKEPDVSPLQLQGPKSLSIMQALFGEKVANLKYYWFFETELLGIPLLISRTGWSSELGYEIFLRDGSKGDKLWENIMMVGEEYDLKPRHTSSIRRIEGGMLSYHADADSSTNPFELGLERLIDLNMDVSFIGKEALKSIEENGIERKLVGLNIDGEPLPGPNTSFWTIVNKDKEEIGKVTSAVYSPRLKKNIALGMIKIEFSTLGTPLEVYTPQSVKNAMVVEKPFYDPKKKIAKTT